MDVVLFAVAALFFVFIGFSLAIIISKIKETKLYKAFIDNNPIESFLLVACIFLGIASILFKENMAGTLLTVFSTFLFSWIVTKRTTAKEYEEKIKENASTAYRHNKSLSVKIQYEIDLIDRVFTRAICPHSQNNCEHTRSLYRMRDSLISFKRDTEENTGDWAAIIAEEINDLNDIVALHKQLKEAKYKESNVEDVPPGDEENAPPKASAVLQEKIDEKMLKLDGKPRYKIILTNELKFADEMADLINEEAVSLESRVLMGKHTPGGSPDFQNIIDYINSSSKA